jgi:hypothetical protein
MLEGGGAVLGCFTAVFPVIDHGIVRIHRGPIGARRLFGAPLLRSRSVHGLRQFQISEQVDQDKIRADLKSGVLSIYLPKAEKAKPKKITVNVAS